MPERLKPIGWLAMISLFEPVAAMYHASSGTPSWAGKLTSSNSRPSSAGVQDGRAPQVAEPISEALQSLIDLHLRGIDFVLNVGHRPFLFLCLFHPCDARLATCRC